MEVPVIKNAKKQDYLVCYLCENDWIETQAKGFCLDCRKYMCTACFDKHTKRKIGRNHTLAPTREAVSTAGSSEDEEFEKCAQHIGEYIKCFCLNHEQVGCGDCMALEHKRCNVKSIRDVAILFKDSQEFKDLVKGVEECHIRAKKITTSVQKTKSQARVTEYNFVKEAHQLSENIISQMKRLKVLLAKQAELIKSMDIKKMDGTKIIKEMSGSPALLDSQMDRPNISNVQQLQQKHERLTKKNSIKNYKFKPDQNLERAAKDCNNLERFIEIKQDAKEKGARRKTKHQPSILWRIPEGVPIKTYGTPIFPRYQICKNIAVNGYYLSHASNGTGFGFCIFDNGGHNEFCFEVEIVSMGHNGVIAIGIAPRIYPANLLPGWGSHSVAYHAQDARLYQENHFGIRNGPQCNVGDRIEVNCRCNSGTYYVHFKRNGETIGEASCGRNVFKRLYPAIGLCSSREEVTIKLDRMLY